MLHVWGYTQEMGAPTARSPLRLANPFWETEGVRLHTIKNNVWYGCKKSRRPVSWNKYAIDQNERLVDRNKCPVDRKEYLINWRNSPVDQKSYLIGGSNQRMTGESRVSTQGAHHQRRNFDHTADSRTRRSG